MIHNFIKFSFKFKYFLNIVTEIKMNKGRFSRNITHKLVKFQGISQNFNLSIALKKINEFVGKANPNNYRGLYIIESDYGKDFRDIAIDFGDERIWKQISRRTTHDATKNETYFMTNDGEVYVDIPGEDWIQRTIVRTHEIAKADKKHNLKIIHSAQHNVPSIINLFENFLDVGGFDCTTSLNELSYLQVNSHCSYVGFNDHHYLNEFLNYVDRKIHMRAYVVDTQPIIRARTAQREARKRNHDDIPEKTVEIQFKQGRRTQTIEFDHEISRPEDLVRTENAEIQRAKFPVERKEPKASEQEGDNEEDDDDIVQPLKKLPRRFRFTIQCKSMRKMFSLMGSGRYAVHLEKDDD